MSRSSLLSTVNFFFGKYILEDICRDSNPDYIVQTNIAKYFDECVVRGIPKAVFTLLSATLLLSLRHSRLRVVATVISFWRNENSVNDADVTPLADATLILI